mgnify:CR=1 FL=1
MFIFIMTDKPDYNNSKIFIISSESTDQVYYGATVHALDDVLHKHTHNYPKSRYESGQIVKYGNAIIQHVEFYPCSSVEELEDRHAYYIMNNRDKCINKHIPGTARRTAGGKRSYYNIIMQKYKELHKKKILENGRQQHECDICGGSYQTRHKDRHLSSFKHKNHAEKTAPLFSEDPFTLTF